MHSTSFFWSRFSLPSITVSGQQHLSGHQIISGSFPAESEVLGGTLVWKPLSRLKFDVIDDQIWLVPYGIWGQHTRETKALLIGVKMLCLQVTPKRPGEAADPKLDAVLNSGCDWIKCLVVVFCFVLFSFIFKISSKICAWLPEFSKKLGNRRQTELGSSQEMGQRTSASLGPWLRHTCCWAEQGPDISPPHRNTSCF